MKKRIYLSSPTMNGREMIYVREAFESNWVAPIGKNIDLFEKDIEEYLGITNAVALSSGTAAIHLSIKLAGVQPGDIVLCSSLTFSATANPILYEKAIPVFIDSEKETWNMDPVALEKALIKYPQAKAVVLVHLYGTPAKLGEIIRICNKYKVPLIEDAAESLGAKYQGQYTGTFGKFAILSFNGNKIITTSGGGMLITKEEEDASKARYLATQARLPARHYQHSEVGYNYRLSNILAGIGRGQMKSLNQNIEKKKRIYEVYSKILSDIEEIDMNPYEIEKSEPNFWLSCITITPEAKISPLEIMIHLDEDDIESRPIWKPMHLQPVFEMYDFIQCVDGTSVSEDIYNRGLCLPSDVKNTAYDMVRIMNRIRELFGKEKVSLSLVSSMYYY